MKMSMDGLEFLRLSDFKETSNRESVCEGQAGPQHRKEG